MGYTKSSKNCVNIIPLNTLDSTGWLKRTTDLRFVAFDQLLYLYDSSNMEEMIRIDTQQAYLGASTLQLPQSIKNFNFLCTINDQGSPRLFAALALLGGFAELTEIEVFEVQISQSQTISVSSPKLIAIDNLTWKIQSSEGLSEREATMIVKQIAFDRIEQGNKISPELMEEFELIRNSKELTKREFENFKVLCRMGKHKINFRQPFQKGLRMNVKNNLIQISAEAEGKPRMYCFHNLSSSWPLV